MSQAAIWGLSHKAFLELGARIKIFCSLPIASLDRMRLKARIDDIGQLKNTLDLP